MQQERVPTNDKKTITKPEETNTEGTTLSFQQLQKNLKEHRDQLEILEEQMLELSKQISASRARLDDTDPRDTGKKAAAADTLSKTEKLYDDVVAKSNDLREVIEAEEDVELASLDVINTVSKDIFSQEPIEFEKYQGEEIDPTMLS